MGHLIAQRTADEAARVAALRRRADLAALVVDELELSRSLAALTEAEAELRGAKEAAEAASSRLGRRPPGSPCP
jgi:hypothetical protein